MCRYIAVAAMVLAMATVAGDRSARADEASDALGKYHKAVDQAIDKALAFLAKNQAKDGSFLSKYTAATSLSVMAFLSKGYTPGSGPYGEVINKGIDNVLSKDAGGGWLAPHGGRMYSHASSTLMLSEVSGMVTAERQKRIDKTLSKALQLILAAQRMSKKGHNNGGWRYNVTNADSDISCTSWALMSLRSARNAGAPVPKEAIDRAVKYVAGLRCGDGGFGYNAPTGPSLARTGTALLCLELCGKHGDKIPLDAGEWILKHIPRTFGGAFFYYGMYYSSQGMFQLGGKYWERWAANMYEMMLKFQAKNGSWPVGSQHEAAAGPCYATAMGVLAMSVSYRQLPIYQR